MDGLSYLGLIVGFAAILIGQSLEGGDISGLCNLPAFLIVLGGTLGAVMVQTPWITFKQALALMPQVFHPIKYDFARERNQLVELTKKARQFGLISLENQLDNEKNPLMRRGLELLMLGVDKTSIRHILDAEVDQIEHRDLHAVHVFESMGGYSPTIGIIGAVLGLIQVMRNLADPSHLGAGIAVAFVATIYGVGLANLIFLPIANKLKSRIAWKMEYYAMLIEGLASIAGGESPAMLTIKLNNYGLKENHAPKKK
jgi:chemotaxis protein MotA